MKIKSAAQGFTPRRIFDCRSTPHFCTLFPALSRESQQSSQSQPPFQREMSKDQRDTGKPTDIFGKHFPNLAGYWILHARRERLLFLDCVLAAAARSAVAKHTAEGFFSFEWWGTFIANNVINCAADKESTECGGEIYCFRTWFMASSRRAAAKSPHSNKRIDAKRAVSL